VLSPFVRQHLRPLTSTAAREDLDVLKELIEAGKVTPVIDKTYLLREAPDAIQYIRAGRARGKLVISIAPKSPESKFTPSTLAADGTHTVPDQSLPESDVVPAGDRRRRASTRAAASSPCRRRRASCPHDREPD